MAGTVGGALAAARRALAAEPQPDVVARTLLADQLGWGSAELLAALGEPLPALERAAFEARVARVAAGEPLAYVVGHQPFLDVSLAVDRRVLVPRPETEELAEWALDWARQRAAGGRPVSRALDVGTGSGALAIAVARGCPGALVVATDIDAAALDVARANADRLGVATRVVCLRADLVVPRGDDARAGAALDGPFDLVVANLPYVGTDERGEVAASVLAHEPERALFAGPDGLALLRRALPLLPPRLAPGAAVGVEIGWRQGDAVAALAAGAFPGARVAVRRDRSDRPRFVIVETAP